MCEGNSDTLNINNIDVAFRLREVDTASREHQVNDKLVGDANNTIRLKFSILQLLNGVVREPKEGLFDPAKVLVRSLNEKVNVLRRPGKPSLDDRHSANNKIPPPGLVQLTTQKNQIV